MTAPFTPRSLHSAAPSAAVLSNCTDAGPSRTLDLFPIEHWEKKAKEIRHLVSQAMVSSGIDLNDAAHDTGVDDRQLYRALKDGGGAHPPLSFLAYVLARDSARACVLLSGLADLCGYEVRRRQVDLAAENRELRSKLAAMRTEIDKLIGG